MEELLPSCSFPIHSLHGSFPMLTAPHTQSRSFPPPPFLPPPQLTQGALTLNTITHQHRFLLILLCAARKNGCSSFIHSPRGPSPQGHHLPLRCRRYPHSRPSGKSPLLCSADFSSAFLANTTLFSPQLGCLPRNALPPRDPPLQVRYRLRRRLRPREAGGAARQARWCPRHHALRLLLLRERSDCLQAR